MREEERYNINLLKILSLDMIDNAKCGYPGITLGAAPIVYTLFTEHLNVMPSNPKWINRDRLVISASHAIGLVYANMYMAGYDITLDDLKNFRMLNSKTPGTPDMLKTPGIDFSTTSSGYGLSGAVGMAIAEKYEKGILNKYIKKQRLIDHYIYCLVSDGDCLSSLGMEAASLAGFYNLGNLIVLYDSNGSLADSSMVRASSEDMLTKFSALGWQTDYVAEGDSVDKIDKAIKRAKRVLNKPSFIEIKTVIGRDSFNQNTNIVHNLPLTKDDLESVKRKYNLPIEKFVVDDKVIAKYRKYIVNRVQKKYKLWEEYHNAMKRNTLDTIQSLVSFFDNKEIHANFDYTKFKVKATYQEELTESNSKIMSIIASHTPYFMGGGADTGSSCRVNLTKETYFSAKNPLGRNILFGPREASMSGIVSGIATYGINTFCANYLRFAYLELDNIKNTALMNLPVTYIFTHEALSTSLEGEGYSSYEILNILRSIPNLDVYRPCDINEVIGCWSNILDSKKTNSLVISNEITHILKGSDASKVSNGAYIIRQEESTASATLVSSGYDVTLSMVVAEELKLEGIILRVVSVPCKNILDRKDKAFLDTLFTGKVIVIEESSKDIWCRYTDYQNIIGINDIVPSGTYKDVAKKLSFDKESIKNKIKELI